MAEATLVEPNVHAAQTLVGLMDKEGLRPRAAVWTYTSDTDAWRLWIVPPAGLNDKREFYLRLADVFAGHMDELAGMDAGDVQYVDAKHPAIQGLSRIFRSGGLSDVRVTGNMLNGYFLPDASSNGLAPRTLHSCLANRQRSDG